MEIVEPLDDAARRLVAGFRPRVREMAFRMAPRGDAMDPEDLFQIGMTELCKIAPPLSKLDQHDFDQRTYDRVRGAMLDACRLAAKVRARERAMRRIRTEVVDRLEVGDFFATVEERVEQGRRNVMCILGASIVSLLGERFDQSPEDTVSLKQQREHIRALLTPLIAQLDPFDWAFVRDVHIDGKTLAGAARQYEIPEREARTRHEKALQLLGAGLKKAGIKTADLGLGG